jgi:hypothetical protein
MMWSGHTDSTHGKLFSILFIAFTAYSDDIAPVLGDHVKVEGEGEVSELVQCGLQPPVGDRGVKLSCLQPPIGRLG